MKKRIKARVIRQDDGSIGMEIVQYSGDKRIPIYLNERDLDCVRNELLAGYPNCVLLKELEKRADVKALVVNPYDDYIVVTSKIHKGSGPARILVVRD